MEPLISLQTLLSSRTSQATVIDLIITNDVEHSVKSSVIQSSITDHRAVMCKISKIQTNRNKTPSLIYGNKRKYFAKVFLMN